MLQADTPPATSGVADSSTRIKYPYKPNTDDPYSNTRNNTLDLKTPAAVEHGAELDTSGKYYKVSSKVGGEDVGEEKQVDFDKYTQDENKSFIRDYFQRRSAGQNNILQKSIIPPKVVDNGLLGNVLGGVVDISPRGTAELTFAVDHNRIQNPSWSLREQNTTQFKFDQKININVIGSIGNRIKLGINYDTQANFDFQNQKKLSYDGQEDEIIKKIELGDVSMPISNSLISGSTSLFGVKAQLQFGKLFVTGLFAQQKSDKKEIVVENGAQRSTFNITADKYDYYRHFFLAQYFYDNFDAFNQNYPSLSNINIVKVEVWVTNGGAGGTSVLNTRNIVAFTDLGETNPDNKNFNPKTAGIFDSFPANNSNTLYNIANNDAALRNYTKAGTRLDQLSPTHLGKNSLRPDIDYYKQDNARLLNPSEFTYNPRLGYISLAQGLEGARICGVAFQYSVGGGNPIQVGEFSSDVPAIGTGNVPQVLFVKMLKGPATRPDLPIWKLMMKNIYSLNSYQISPQDFKMQVIFEDNRSGAYLNYIPEPSDKNIDGIPLIRVLGMDKLNSQQEPKPDGNFDYLEGVTVNSSSGRIIFPVVEPFGRSLRKRFKDSTVGARYTYDSLYRSIPAIAIQQADRNKFSLRGTYSSSSGADINLNAINVPPGSVHVYAGGTELKENTDYTVDYGIGRVKIINPGILNSGAVIRVSLESNTLFSIQQKTLMGSRMEYRFNKNFYIGGTFMYLRERPLTPKVNVGDEPIRNAIYGLDGAWSQDSRFITRWLDKLPFYDTKERSTVSLRGEFAEIIPGHPKLLNAAGDNGGVSYIDDFEGAEVPYDLRLGNYWVLSSTPQGFRALPEGDSTNQLANGFRRAKLAWYTIDPLFFRNNTLTPAHIKADKELQSNHFQREVLETEVFPNKQLPNGVPGTLPTFDLAYYPKERGPYNYSTNLRPNGTLADTPTSNWAGIMRRIDPNDFEQANIQYIEFWLMNPFVYNNNKGGDMYIHLGNVSEDILRDTRHSWENGLPTGPGNANIDTTAFGQVPTQLQIVNAFDNNADSRRYQDVGYDGLGPVGSEEQEQSFFQASYLTPIKAILNADAFNRINGDPSGDNFHFYTGGDLDAEQANILLRYKEFNGVEGNTPIASANQTAGYGSSLPDDEDINKDFTINPTDNYFEYHVKITPNDLQNGGLKNYIVDHLVAPVSLRNGKLANVDWYQFKVPVSDYTRTYGAPDLKGVRSMRIFLTNFDTTTICRFATLELVRAEWRKYLFNLGDPRDIVPADPTASEFTVGSVSIEQNSHRQPPYVLPPGILRQTDVTTPDQIQQNEQSLSLRTCGLEPGDARAVFKNTIFDIRQYKHLKCFVHAEGSNGNVLNDNEAHFFIRIGADLTNNYYEYDLPLKATPLNTRSVDAIWPGANNVDVTLSDFYNSKVSRLAAGVSLTEFYRHQSSDGRAQITVIGNPDLSNIKTIMMGIRNPKIIGKAGRKLCAEIWIDELRVTDFDEHGGWAANGTAKVKLADLGTIALSGSRRTIGFGTLEQSVQQRSQKDTRAWDFASAIDLGKLFPKTFYLRIPMYFSYGQTISRPRYNPLSPDLPFDAAVEAFADKRRQDSVLKANEDYVDRTSLNFTNVAKTRSPKHKKTHFYEVENLYATFSFTEIFRRNIEKVYEKDKTYRGILGYSYSFPAKPVTPFKRFFPATGKAYKYTKLISDFNFYYLPATISFSGQVDRHYDEILYRNTDNYKAIIQPVFDKTFQIRRNYDVRWNLAKSLKVSYSAIATSRIPEPDGRIDDGTKKAQLWDSIRSLGKLSNYNQSINAAYEVPIAKLPFFDWTTLQTTYVGTYSWTQPPPIRPTLGATIANSRTMGGNLQLNFGKLYSKIKFFKNIIDNKSNVQAIQRKKQDEVNAARLKAGKDTLSKPAPINAGAIRLGEGLARILTSIRSVAANYTLTEGIALPGFQPVPNNIGLHTVTGANDDPKWIGAPGLGFVFGDQSDIRQKAKDNNWISQDTNITAFYLRTRQENFTGQAVVEPIKGLRVNIDFTKRNQYSESSLYRYRDGDLQPLSTVTAGTYSVSYAPLSTSFSNGDVLFQHFEAFRRTIATRLNQLNPNPNTRNKRDDSTGYPLGYGPTQQEVLVYAFIAAYTGKSADNVPLSAFPKIPLPNWRINYTGLSNLDFVKRYAKNVTITHGYRSTYTVPNYQTTLDYNPAIEVAPKTNILPQRRIDNIQISEDYNPLIGMDVTWINNLSTRLEYRKSRLYSLATTNYQVSETNTSEFVIGAGYRTNKFLLPFRVNRKRTYLKNDLNFRLDFSIRDNRSALRILDQNVEQSYNGQQIIAAKPQLDYQISKNLLARAFFIRNIVNPHVSSQYPTSQINFGFTLRYQVTP